MPELPAPVREEVESLHARFNLPRHVRAEMEKFFLKEHRGGTSKPFLLVHFLNNFHFNFSPHDRELFKGDLNKRKYTGEFQTPKKSGNTMGEFYAECDAAVKEAGLKKEEVEKLIREAGLARNNAKLNEAIFPVYLKLREKGYSHYDLTGAVP